jgi:hypothetical protein
MKILISIILLFGVLIKFDLASSLQSYNKELPANKIEKKKVKYCSLSKTDYES